jgi:hypothetical protein
MRYDNPELIERYKDKLGLSGQAALQLFHDVKQFLYVCGTQNENGCSPTEKIDLGWHEFLLYSRDYREFCEQMFGQLVEHAPRSYLKTDRRPKGEMRRTYLVARSIFGVLSENWDQAAPDTGSLYTASPCDACSNSDCTWVGNGQQLLG